MKTEISVFGNGGDKLEHELVDAAAESSEPSSEDRDIVERGMNAYNNLTRRTAELEQALNRAILAIKSRDVEIESLRLQIAERDNRITSIQTIASEREERYLAERDAAISEAAEYRAIHVQIRHLYERVQLPLPHLPPSEPTSDVKPARRKRSANGEESEPVTGK